MERGECSLAFYFHLDSRASLFSICISICICVCICICICISVCVCVYVSIFLIPDLIPAPGHPLLRPYPSLYPSSNTLPASSHRQGVTQNPDRRVVASRRQATLGPRPWGESLFQLENGSLAIDLGRCIDNPPLQRKLRLLSGCSNFPRSSQAHCP